MEQDPTSSSEPSATPELACVDANPDPSETSECDLDKAQGKYAHAGRRRKRITEDLFRCALPLIIKDQRIPCNALIWRRPDKMREHLIDHMSEDEISALSDDEVRSAYRDASRIVQEGIPDDDEE